MQQGLLPLRLNFPWRATASAAMAGSALLGSTAAIGAVRLAAPAAHARSTSTLQLRVPLFSPKVEVTDTLCVVLRIDPFASLGCGAEAQIKIKGSDKLYIRTLFLCILIDFSFLGTVLIIGEGSLLDSYPVRGLSSEMVISYVCYNY